LLNTKSVIKTIKLVIIFVSDCIFLTTIFVSHSFKSQLYV